MKSFLVNIRINNEPIACWDSTNLVEAFEVACEVLSEDDFSEAIFFNLRDRLERITDMVIGETRDITEQHVTVRILCEEKEQEEGEE
jgi:hypothetical protein